MVMRDTMKPVEKIIGARVVVTICERAHRGMVRDIMALKPEIEVLVKLDDGGTVKAAWNACAIITPIALQKVAR